MFSSGIPKKKFFLLFSTTVFASELARKDMDVNEHERLYKLTLYTFKQILKVLLLLFYILLLP